MLVEKVFVESDGTYGYRRVAATLGWKGIPADVDTVRSVMRELGLRAAQLRAKVRTTIPAEDLGDRADLVRRDFTSPVPGGLFIGATRRCVRHSYAVLTIVRKYRDCVGGAASAVNNPPGIK